MTTKAKTVNDMTPEERFRFEFSLDPAKLRGEGFDEQSYVQHRLRDWGLAGVSPDVAPVVLSSVTRQAARHEPDPANPLVSRFPQPGQVGSDSQPDATAPVSPFAADSADFMTPPERNCIC